MTMLIMVTAQAFIWQKMNIQRPYSSFFGSGEIWDFKGKCLNYN